MAGTFNMNTVLKFTFITGFALLLACQTPPSSTTDDREEKVRETALAFFDTYAERQDWDAFCSFYREDLQFKDVLLQLELDSLWKFKRFYNWPDTNFAKLSPEQKHVEIHTMVVQDSIVTAYGHFNPFYWYDQKIEEPWGMEVVFVLHFDQDQKIIRQVDWIEYAPETLQSVIDRVREKGLQKVPDWLDLSRD
jgi:hypothetical protein